MRQWLFGKRTVHTPKAETAAEVVVMARTEAFTRRQEYVGTQHLLLALARLTERPAGRVLSEFGLTREVLETVLSEYLQQGLGQVAEAELPCTPTTRGLMGRLTGSDSSPESLLVAILAEKESVVQDILTKAGFDLESIRARLSP